MLEAGILTVSVLISLFAGLVVFARNPKNKINILFAVFSLSAVLLTINNFFSLQTDERLFYIRSVIFFSVLLTSSLYFLIYFIKNGSKPMKRHQIIGVYYTVLVASLCYTPLVFVGLTDPPNPVPVPALGSVLFFAHLVVFLAGSFFLLIKGIKNIPGKKRAQFSYILLGFIPMLIFSPITGFILPVLLGNSDYIALNPIYITFLVVMISLAVIRHRLFDVRLVVARSLGYLFSIATLGAVYGFIAFSIINAFVFTDTTSTGFRQTIYTLLAIVMAFTFQSIKRFFDKLTNRLFYRDAYDSQALLDELNQVLVSNIELEKLLSKSADVIGRTIKADFCLFEVKKTEDEPQRIIGVGKSKFSDAQIEDIRTIAPRVRVKTINTDELEEDGSGLRAKLRKNDIAVLVRLTDAPEKPVEGLGHIILGFKKSGNPYSSQDTRILEIIADELVIAIQNALRFEEIQNFNITLQQKVDDATRKLRKANEKLIALDQTKDDFISMASHQLRTPLTSVKGYVSMVLEGDVGKVSRKQKDLLNQAYVSSQRMVYLISDLLNVSRLRTGKFVIDPRPTNLAEVVSSEIAQLTETAKARNLELEYHRPKDFPKLNLDETKIRQVIMNFVDNAIYYTPAGGHINVVVEDKDESIEFRVEDNGLGVPKSEQHHLFTKFYRAKNAKKARPDGTGLGLFMAKKVIVAQGGAVIFSSKENKGSTFGFSFPKKRLLSGTE